MSNALVVSTSNKLLNEIKGLFTEHMNVSFKKDLVFDRESFPDGPFDFIFVGMDVFSSEPSGVSDQLKFFTGLYSEARSIVVGENSQIREIVEIVRCGAHDYLTVPVDPAEFSLFLERLNTSRLQNAQIKHFEKALADKSSQRIVEASSSSMKEVFSKVDAVADKTANVLLTGETGVGKGVIARMIHEHSSRKDKPFISVHCGAIPESLVESELFGHEKGAFTGAIKRKLGRFELAHGGTIFLDEIGTVSSSIQIKLLQVLQESIFQRVGGEEDIKVDVRIISATNEDLSELVTRKDFRQDLYYRLNVFPILIPPLRDRLEDLELLVKHFVMKFSHLHQRDIQGVSSEALKCLRGYSWPGNIRELENIVERACIIETSSELQLTSFPMDIISLSGSEPQVPIITHLPLAEARAHVISDFERKYFVELMTQNEGKIKDVAEQAQVGVRQVHKLLSKYGLMGREFRGRSK